LSARPSKVIRSELQTMNEKSLELKDLKCVAKAVYRRRRTIYPPLPTSQQETHENLQKMNTETNKFENFLQVNDAENGIIIFTCISNLQCLCEASEIFMDGTFRCCPKFFNQLDTIHGYKDGNYIPLAFMLLPGKSEEIYHTCISALIKLCSEKNLQFQPSFVHIDFEKAVMTVISQLLPDSTIKCCRFQAWWRQIQKAGLSSECKDRESQIGRWLK
jgi:hypothetical protein